MRFILAGILLCIIQSGRCDGSDTLPSFFTVTNVDALQTSPLDEYQLSLAEQKNQRYIGEDQPIEEHTYLQNDLFVNENVRIYNHSQYSVSDITEKYSQEKVSQMNLSDLSVSLGYGMEFKLSDSKSWGYEYLSTFPYDRGQSLRFFFRSTF